MLNAFATVMPKTVVLRRKGKLFVTEHLLEREGVLTPAVVVIDVRLRLGVDVEHLRAPAGRATPSLWRALLRVSLRHALDRLAACRDERVHLQNGGEA